MSHLAKRLLWTVLLVLSLPLPAAAISPTVQTNLDVSQTVKGTQYLSGQDVTVSGQVSGDVYILAQHVAITGTIDGDVTVVAREFALQGTIKGDLHAVTLVSALDGTVTGTTSIASMQLVSTGDLNDIFAAAIGASFGGTIKDDAWVIANQVEVPGQISHALHARAQALLVRDKAHVSELDLVSPIDPLIETGATVDQQHARREPYRAFFRYEGWRGHVASWAGYFVWLLIGTLALVLFAPHWLQRSSSQMASRFFLNLWVGLGVALISPLILFGLIWSRVGWLAAGIVVIALLAASQIGIMIFCYTLGERLWRLGRTNTTNGLWAALLGAAVVAGVFLIPLAGPLLEIIIVVLGLGTLTRGLWRSKLVKPSNPSLKPT